MLHVWSNVPTRSTSSLARLLTQWACFVMVRCFCYHNEARRIVQHRDRTRRGNSSFPFHFVFRIGSCIFPFEAHISSWSRTRDMTLIRGLNHGWNSTIVTPLRWWDCDCSFDLHLVRQPSHYTWHRASTPIRQHSSAQAMLLPSFTSSVFGAINFQFQNNSGFIVFQTGGKSQCLLKMLAGFFFPAMWWMLIMPAAIAYRTQW